MNLKSLPRFASWVITLTLSTSLSWSQTYPNKTVRIIEPAGPGSAVDVFARRLATPLAERLGQPVVVDNKPGAGGQIGAAVVAKAAPDGYTLMLDASSFAVNPSLYAKLPYDSLKAFRPVGLVALFPNVVLVNAKFAPQNVADLIALAKKSKDAVSYASSGNGSAQHLAGALFESENAEKTSISTEELETVLAEIKESRKITT